MSASLVGSEMCIRDSHLPASHPGVRTCRGRVSGKEIADTDSLIRPSAVSYTHLTLPTICSV
eukprot:13447608-Alexandrium_andersonii.AAC.1